MPGVYKNIYWGYLNYMCEYDILNAMYSLQNPWHFVIKVLHKTINFIIGSVRKADYMCITYEMCIAL